MTSVTGLSPNFGSISAHTRLQAAAPQFGSISKDVVSFAKPATQRVIPFLAPVLAGLAGLAVLPLMIFKMKACLVGCCVGTVALGALLGLTLFK
jgi:hypothetical protein